VKRKVNLSEITSKEPLKVKTTIQPSVMNLPKEEVSNSSPFELEVEITKKAVGYQLAISSRERLRERLSSPAAGALKSSERKLRATLTTSSCPPPKLEEER